VRPIRALHVLRKLDRGGIETWLYRLVRHFDRRDVAMDFLVQAAEPGQYDQEIRELGARILPCANAHLPWRYGRNFLRILREQEPYDVVHSHHYFFSGVDLRLAASRGVPARVAHIHPCTDVKVGAPLRRAYRGLMKRWIARYAHAVVSPSLASLKAFQEQDDWSHVKSAIIHNCLNLEKFRGAFDTRSERRRLGLPEDRPVVVYVARFVDYKRHGLIFPVADRLRAKGVQAHFVLAGSDGESRPGVEAQAAQRSDVSVFVNEPDITPLLRSADMFLFPSLEEGFGVVAIEAAAAGLPVVASDLPSIREALAPSQHEFTFALADDETAAAHVARILTDNILREKLVADGRRFAEQFGVEQAASELRGLYESLLTGRQAAREMVAA
jgi:glycosyltransferase involved in cell wall biosynthesis